MSQRANLIKARGLITFSSELDVPEGALIEATNVNIDENSVITPRRGFNDFGSEFATETDRINQVMQYKDRVFRHYNSTLQFENDLGDFTSFSGTYNELVDGLRLKYKEVKGNLYFTTSSGIKKLSLKNASGLSSAVITNAGGIKAVDLDAKIQPTVGGFLPPQSKTGYRLVFGTKDKNGMLILGSPSARFVLENTSKDVSIKEQSSLEFIGAGPADSDYFLLSTTGITYSFWFNVTGAGTPPNTKGDTVGTILHEIDLQAAVSTDEMAALTANSILGSVADFDVIIDPVNASKTVVTAKAEGDIPDLQDGSVLTNVTTATNLNGSVTTGTSANAEISFTLPQDITTDYFYQIYRTANITAIEGLTLNDIDPGDDMNLAYEAPITDADITAGEITIEENTPESFRASGVILYTSPNSGEGILQANEPPPIAQDIELFNNSTFYANTKSRHRSQINLLSVDDFISGTSELIISNKDIVRRYTFVGSPETSDITVDTTTNTTNGSSIVFYSANDGRKYTMYFDKGGASQPAVDNTVFIRVDLTQYDDTIAGTISAMKDAMITNSDFVLQDNGDDGSIGVNDIRINNTNNGNCTDLAFGPTVPGGAWIIGTIVQGTGEDFNTADGGDVLLSGLSSVSQAIDETARSIVKTINRDLLSPVNAFYLSGATDLPGIILIENKSLEDIDFFLAVNDAPMQTEFNPEMPLEMAIDSVTFSAGSNTPAKITDALGHGYSTGDEAYIYSPDTVPSFVGKYTVTVLSATEFTVPVNITTEDPTGTNAFYFITDVESDNLETPNRLYYSKLDQPEAVPITNYIDIGPKDEPIERIIALMDNLVVFKTDGVYLVYGSSAPNFSARLLDNSVNILAPDSAVVLNNKIYCLTTQGISTVSNSVQIMSRPIENLINDVVNARYNYKYKTFGVAYENDRAYVIWLPTEIEDEVATQAYRFNTFERSWTRWDIPATCGLVKDIDDKMYIGDGTRNYLLQERKEGNRTDFSDRNFTLTIDDNMVNDNVIELSSVTNVTIGDVLVQSQTVTVDFFNRFLRKLDIDTGMQGPDGGTTTYNEKHNVVAGNNITTALNALNIDLVADDDSGTVTPRLFNSDFLILQTEFNEMIAELNDSLCDTNLKNYRDSNDIVPFETVVTAKNTIDNEVTVYLSRKFISGPIETYKGIASEVQWSPQAFGDPSAMKQMRESSIIFDQNNFYSASVSFSSDVSADFTTIPFLGKGPGYWGDIAFGNPGYYWGGNGNDIPFRTLIPTEKQRARYLNVKFNHINARETWRIIGVSAVVRAISSRAYR